MNNTTITINRVSIVNEELTINITNEEEFLSMFKNKKFDRNELSELYHKQEKEKHWKGKSGSEKFTLKGCYILDHEKKYKRRVEQIGKKEFNTESYGLRNKSESTITRILRNMFGVNSNNVKPSTIIQ